ncbi:hypothetical protein EJ05DRAFT_525772 [Pseudovirgaria hyperparasitica]|uniref:Uncharacterized protein n=1 Tax=Pseudovirgaria hyperparasitica TaxID=470096 RepID=A0A6A6WG96_9PEZI|nr:uncharacterized protein EJ05DRAFT_525772 [Pseudovirgaria hyperparasitica]KAF2760647.1 hypothetical protein EJ05DRAFT_525772 [Pseudovirgaria hyperparasitica]
MSFNNFGTSYNQEDPLEDPFTTKPGEYDRRSAQNYEQTFPQTTYDANFGAAYPQSPQGYIPAHVTTRAEDILPKYEQTQSHFLDETYDGDLSKVSYSDGQCLSLPSNNTYGQTYDDQSSNFFPDVKPPVDAGNSQLGGIKTPEPTFVNAIRWEPPYQITRATVNPNFATSSAHQRLHTALQPDNDFDPGLYCDERGELDDDDLFALGQAEEDVNYWMDVDTAPVGPSNYSTPVDDPAPSTPTLSRQGGSDTSITPKRMSQSSRARLTIKRRNTSEKKKSFTTPDQKKKRNKAESAPAGRQRIKFENDGTPGRSGPAGIYKGVCDINVRLPEMEITDEELITFFPNLLVRHKLAARLIYRGWGPTDIAAVQSTHRTEEQSYAYLSTVTRQLMRGGLAVIGSNTTVESDDRFRLNTWRAAVKAGTAPAPTPDQLTLSTKQFMTAETSEHRVSVPVDARLADFGRNVKLWPKITSDLTMLIRWAYENQKKYKLSQVPELLYHAHTFNGGAPIDLPCGPDLSPELSESFASSGSDNSPTAPYGSATRRLRSLRVGSTPVARRGEAKAKSKVKLESKLEAKVKYPIEGR